MKRHFPLSLRCLIVCLCIIASPLLKAQTHTPRTVTVSTHCGGYWEYLPANYNSTNIKYPVIIYIHGGASYGNGSTSALNVMLQNEGLPYYISHNLFPATFPLNGGTTSFIVISPQFISAPSPQEIKTVIDFVLQTYRVDLMRVYFTGYSVGGDVAWKTPYNLAAANRLAALVPAAGYNNPYYDTTAQFIAAANLPVWAIHSNSDATIPVSASQNMVDKINSFNPLTPAIITRLNGVTHDSTVLVAFNPQFRPNGKSIYEWFLQYAKNYPPVSNAGNDITITMPVVSATLNGTGSSDPENGTLLYNWTKISGPLQYNINNATLASPFVSNLVAGIYKFKLTVTDNGGLTSNDTMQLTVINPNPNQLPIAMAGNDMSIQFPQTSVSLSSAGSSDPDGDIETYAWNKISGPSSFTITNPSSANTTVTGLRPGIYKFQLIVTDNQGATANDTVQVTLTNSLPNALPVANAGADQSITLATSAVTLNGSSSSDPDGVITAYVWRQVSGPASSTLNTPNAASTSASGLATAGTYLFELKVTDDSSAIAKDSIQVIVNNQPGKAVPGLIEAESYDNMLGVVKETTGDVGGGQDVGYIDNGDWMDYLINVSTTGTYTINLRVAAPNAGAQFQFRKGTTVLSTVAIPQTGGWQTWTTFSTTLPLTAGLQTLRVYSNTSGWNFNWMSFSTSASNQSPIASAGSNQTITLPTATVTLNGSGVDPDGTIASYAWTNISGPNTPSITSAGSATTDVTGLIQGVYVLRLTVTDNLGATGTSDVTITVNATNNNANPTITTNNPQNITTSTASFTSIANTGFPISSTQWTKFSVPGQTIKTLTVIGSSTAAGNGASINDSSFVAKLKAYYTAQGIITNITNLAVSGSTPFDINITTALNYGSNVLLVSYPSNGYTASTNAAVIARLQEIKDSCDNRGVQYYITGTQPRNDFGPADRANLIVLNDSLRNRFGSRFINFLTPILNTTDNSIKVQYSAGDGIHENDSGHEVFYQLVRATNIFQNTFSSSSVITTPTSSGTSVTGLALGVHKFQVSIIDSRGLAASAVAMVTVSSNNPPNQPPVARAGADQSINLPATSVSLNGTASTDDHNIVAYQWTKLASSTGAGGTFGSPTASTTTFTGLSAGIYNVELKVTDDSSAIGRDTVQIVVNAYKPIPGHIEAETFDLMSGVVIEGTSDAGGGSEVGYIDNGDWMDYNVFVASTGTYTVKFRIASPNNGAQLQVRKGATVLLTVPLTNTGGWQTWTTVTVSLPLVAGSQTLRVYSSGSGWNFNWVDFVSTNQPNQPPVAKAGADQTITLPVSSVSLNGTASTDDHNIVAYQWTKLPSSTGTGGAFGTATASTTTFTGLSAGIYNIELRVTDDSSAVGRDTVQILVNPPLNQPPVARAGADQVIVLPANSVSLDGSTSTDDHNIVAYQWTKLPSSTGAGGTFGSATASTSTFTGLSAGIYNIELRVTDDSSAIGRDTVKITVNAANVPNQPPVAKAGADQTITLPVSSVSLNGTASTDDHNIVAYQWTKLLSSTGAGGTFGSPTGPTTTFTGLSAGIYNIELRVTDDSSAIGRDTVQILVNPPLNQPPVARAGVDQTITLPANSVSLSGTTSSDDHNIVAYQWTKLPSSTGTGGTFGTPTVSTTTFTGLSAGIYNVELRVTDDSSAVGRDTVQITVLNSGKVIAGHIEAESYDAMLGVVIEPTSDAGGGSEVGYIDNGDWMNYNVTVTTTGTYTASFRVASPNAGAQFQVRIGTTILVTVPVPNTGGWQTWTTITASVPLTAGAQTLRIYCSGSGWNFNWMDFTLPGTSTVHIEAPEIEKQSSNDLVTNPALRIFPNPVTNQLTVELNNDYSGPVRIRIIDQNGSLRKETQFTKNKGTAQVVLATSGLSSGAYIVEVHTSAGTRSVKMLKL